MSSTASILVDARSGRTALLLRLVPWCTLATLALVGWVQPELSARLAPWPFLISAVLLGLPHGAVDLWLSGRSDHGTDWRLTATRFAAYLALMAAMIGLVFVAPKLAITLFGAATAVHFGVADRRDARRLVRDLIDPKRALTATTSTDLLAGVGRGLILLAAPFVFAPTETVQVLNSLFALLQAEPLGETAIVRPVSLVLLIAGFVLWLAESATARPSERIGLFRLEAIELLLIVAAFATLHPAFAMGAYFLCWHSLRHFVTLAEAAAPREMSWPTRFVYLHLVSLPLLVPTLLAIVLLALLLGVGAQPYSLMLLLLLVFIIVTPSHHLLVERVVPRLMLRRTSTGVNQ
jgi:Brp/Blh family beta-carotene 15,15'-monooxygenase